MDKLDFVGGAFGVLLDYSNWWRRIILMKINNPIDAH